MHSTLLLLHFLGATIWTGGHLILALSILPTALRNSDVDTIRTFESRFERVGIPDLGIQIVTGVLLVLRYFPQGHGLMQWDNPVARLALIKLGLLALTAGLAIDARLRLIPRLDPDNLKALAWHIIPVTFISALFVYIGLRFRFGGL